VKQVMFTKHLEGLDLDQIIAGIRRVGIEGTDLCVRPGYPVNPANCATELPAAAKRFAEAGLCIPIITTPGDFNDPADPGAEPVFAACAEAGVPAVKLGYWIWQPDGPGYWQMLDGCRAKLEGFATLAAKYGVKACVHTHSGNSMGLNASAVMTLVKGFDPAHIGVFLDVGHLGLVGERIALALEIVWEYLELLAMKDLAWFKAPGDMETPRSAAVVPFGHGNVEWGALVTELKRRRYDGTLVFHCEYGAMPPESVLDQAAIDVRSFRALWDRTEEPAAVAATRPV